LADRFRGLEGMVWDWGDTLMRDIPGQAGPMAQWPEVKAMPGAREALEALRDIPIHCLATNAQDSGPDDVAAALERVGLRHLLTRILVSPELGVAKPDPGFFREVAGRLGLPPDKLVSVGNDYGKDIVPARAVGMRTILVAGAGAPGTRGTGQREARASGAPPGPIGNGAEAFPDADRVIPSLRSLAAFPRDLFRP